MEINNRKAKYDYFIEEEFECGIELLGTEIKSIRSGNLIVTTRNGHNFMSGL